MERNQLDLLNTDVAGGNLYDTYRAANVAEALGLVRLIGAL